MKLIRGNTINKLFIDALNKLSKLSFNVKTSIDIVKTIKVIYEENNNTSSVRDSIMKHWGLISISNKGLEFEKDELKNTFNQKEFLDKFNELMNETFDIPLDSKITLDSNAVITAEELIMLKDILEY